MPVQITVATRKYSDYILSPDLTETAVQDAIPTESYGNFGLDHADSMLAPCLLGCPGTTRYQPSAGGTPPRRVAGILPAYSVKMLVDWMNRTPEQRTLNPRVRGSSPWRRTRTDLEWLQVVLFSEPVGPMWGQFPVGCAFVFGLRACWRPGRRGRVGVVRIVGSLGQVGPRAVTSAFPGCLTIQAVISASTGALRLRTLPPPGGLLPAFRTRRAAAAAALRPSSTATLR